MAAFEYLALTPEGVEQKGVAEADSSQQLRQQLRDRQLTPLNIQSLKQGQEQGGGGFQLWRRGLATEDLALMTRQLGTLLQSGMPLADALAVLSKQSEKPKVASLIASIRAGVLEGRGLAASMGDHPQAFPAMYRASIAAGEQAGKLDRIILRLADHTEKRGHTQQKLLLAMIYPALLVLVTIGIVSGLLIFVVPDVVEVFQDQGQTLPPLTRGLLAVSGAIGNYGGLMFVLLIALAIGTRWLLSRPGPKLKWHKLITKLPLIGTLSKTVNSSQFAATVSLLINSGVPLVDALRIATDVVPNLWWRDRLQSVRVRVQEGSSLNRSMEEAGGFPPMMLAMVASGEASGELDAMLERVADAAEREQDAALGTIMGLFEPFVLIIMGVSVLLIVVAILQPIFELNQLV